MVDMTDDVDEAGWQYSVKFHGAVWHGNYKHFRSFVRRRRWIRLRHHVSQPQQTPDTSLQRATSDVRTRQLIKLDDESPATTAAAAESSHTGNEANFVEKLRNCRLDRERRSAFDSLLSTMSSSQLNSLLEDDQKVTKGVEHRSNDVLTCSFLS
jgi:hypothetical protein